MIDANVSLFQWPFRRLAAEQPAELVARLRKKGVQRAWAGSFEAMLHRDITSVNGRLAAACANEGKGLLLPFGTVNPMLPEWREDLRLCQEQYGMPGIRLYPNYHGYTLTHPVVEELLSLAAQRRLIVQMALIMEDERNQNPLVRVPPVDPAPLVNIVKRVPDLRLVLLNANRAILARSRELARASQVWFDIAMIDGIGAVADAIASASSSRILFGSHYPFFYFESALLKVWEADLSQDQSHALLEGNARGLLPPS